MAYEWREPDLDALNADAWALHCALRPASDESREKLSDRMALAMRSTVSMCSIPHGDRGAKIVIEMSDETNLYELLEAAWDAARLKRAQALSDPAALDGETLP